MANKSRSKSAEGYAALYKSSRKWEANRMRKLTRTLKEQPNNQQIKPAMQSMVYRRKTPKTSEWSATWIKVAKLIKQFTGRFDRNIMSSNPKIASDALQSCRGNLEYKAPDTPVGPYKSMFSILSRANMNSPTKWK